MRWLESTRNIGTLSAIIGLVLTVTYFVALAMGEDVDSYMGTTGGLAMILGMVLRHYNPAPDESQNDKGPAEAGP